jgi:polysaccharide export outer membrane protein
MLAALALAGCSHMPVNGPEYRDIDRGATSSISNPRGAIVYDYALVDINPIVLQVLDSIAPDSFFQTFKERHRGVPVVRVGVGDVVQASIFESSSGGLFVPGDATSRGGNYVTLPAQTVSGSGMISVPYAGTVRASGRTASEIQRDIETKLAKRAIEPQVLINVVEQNADSATVIGDAGSSKIRITGSGERILDMISRAGGAGATAGRFAGYELVVTLQRRGRVAAVPFVRLIADARENIYVAPGDVIYVTRQPKSFVAFGALASVGGGGNVENGQTAAVSTQFNFSQEHLNLNEALSRAGGLADGRANPQQVFVFRPERRETLEKMGVDLAAFDPSQRLIPTVYRANFRDPSSFFFAQRFEMRDKDVIYASNSDATEVLKVLGYVNAWMSTASNAFVQGRTIGDIASGAHVLSNASTVVVSP